MTMLKRGDFYHLLSRRELCLTQKRKLLFPGKNALLKHVAAA